eukprot:TRINITY_DN5873_c0_g1_i1.p1 TRINITY_DN5873_c0_g1~~TRINITY_DN5873_c0_g1_i1.p1  ORF type:complete len:122 (-),score=11.67 TRINITY_DN5873_c0_g1_i1:36-401(-)
MEVQTKTDASTSGAIEFFKDWKIEVTGKLKRGSSIEIVYDYDRLPLVRSSYVGVPNWDIYVCYRFSPDQKFREKPMLRDPSYILSIPENAEFLELYFWNVGNGGSFYDSNYSQNFHFQLSD